MPVALVEPRHLPELRQALFQACRLVRECRDETEPELGIARGLRQYW